MRSALDMGCGAGREALLMASWGWRAVAVDRLPDALEIGRQLERRYAHPKAPRVDWRCCDLEAEQAGIEGEFGLAACFRYLNRCMIRRAHERLATGGILIVETFTEVHRETFGKPRRQEFVLALGELPELAEGLELVEFAEGWHEGAHTARLWARKQ